MNVAAERGGRSLASPLHLITVAVATALSALVAACSGTHPTGVEGKEVAYTANGTTLKGYLAYNASSNAKRPGVLVVHEWWGQNEYARHRARQLAELGYVALAVDMYGEGKLADNPAEAGKLAGEVMSNTGLLQARLLAAKEYLSSVDVCDPTKVAAIGFCFGGGVVLQAARMGMDLKGVVSFHGSPLTSASPAQDGTVIAKILVLNGADDPLVGPEQIEAFKKEMDNAGVDYRIISYPGAVHAFTNPAADSLGKLFKIPIAYNKEAEAGSWNEMKAFLQKIFQ